MAQQSFSNGDQLLDVREDLNANAAENESRNTTNTGNIATNAADIVVLEARVPANVVVIKEAADWPATLVDDTQYNVHESVDMGAVSPIIPAAGNSISIMGIGPSATLTSSENSYTMFTDVTNSGSVQIQNIVMTASGTSSKLFDLTNDGTGVFICSNTTFSNCTEIGTINGHSFFSLLRSQDSGCTDGWTVDGTIVSIDTNQCGSFGMASGGTSFKAGASLSVTSRVVFNGLFNIPTGATFCDFSASEIAEDAGLNVVSSDFSGDGTYFSNINEKSIKSRWSNNNFPSIPPDNTHVGGGWHIADSGDEVINSTTPTTYTKVNGTTTPLDLQWFSGATANDITMDSSRAVNAEISGVIYFEGTNNATIQCKLVADDGTPTDIFELGEVEFVGTNAPLAYPIAGIPVVLSSASTVIELHAKSSSGSFTAKVHSSLFISERS